ILRGLLTHIRVTCTDPRDCWAYTIGEDPETREPMAADCALVEVGGIVKRAAEADALAPFSLAVPCMLIGKDEGANGSFFYAMALGRTGTGEYCRIGFASLEDDEWFKEAIEETVRIV